MMRAMTVTLKRAYTLDAEVVSELEQEFEPGDRSRFISDAARRALVARRARQFLADRDAAFGPVPPAIQTEADNLPIPR